jgi:hypothetical protein
MMVETAGSISPNFTIEAIAVKNRAMLQKTNHPVLLLQKKKQYNYCMVNSSITMFIKYGTSNEQFRQFSIFFSKMSPA